MLLDILIMLALNSVVEGLNHPVEVELSFNGGTQFLTFKINQYSMIKIQKIIIFHESSYFLRQYVFKIIKLQGKHSGTKIYFVAPLFFLN